MACTSKRYAYKMYISEFEYIKEYAADKSISLHQALKELCFKFIEHEADLELEYGPLWEDTSTPEPYYGYLKNTCTGQVTSSDEALREWVKETLYDWNTIIGVYVTWPILLHKIIRRVNCLEE